MNSGPLHAAIRRLAAGEPLTRDEAAGAFGCIMRGEGTEVQVSALLMGLRVKGETPEELAGAATALREAMTVLPADAPEQLVDTCGTGGGAVTTFNISTAAALLAAGTGVRVAKHGNRSFTSRSGSADVLEALGVRIDIPVERMGDVLNGAGIVFMFAPTMHPAMRHVGPVRRELAIQTVMNLVGPLANPARAGRQVIGVADARRLGLLGGALQALGTTHSLIVHGEPGLDEISPLGSTKVLELVDGEARSWTLEPQRHGVPSVAESDLIGAEPADNARIVEEVLAGRGRPGAVAAVTLNAAAAIYVSGLAGDFTAALALAREALRDGAGRAALEKLRTVSSRAAAKG
ncbi:MAG: anthranilate phosphoribosyltransferase [Gemmatimonas sp.]|nr:anthranilate phosphoribosyltransferase [Gemmatimonas sp.]